MNGEEIESLIGRATKIVREECSRGTRANAEGHMVIETANSYDGEVKKVLDIRAEEDLDARDADVVGDGDGRRAGSCR